MMIATLIVWAHALVALVFGLLVLSQMRRGGAALPRMAFMIALGATVFWALAVAGIGAGDPISWVAEAARNIAWLVFMGALVRRGNGPASVRPIAIIYAMLAAMVVVSAGLSVISASFPAARNHAAIEQVAGIMRMLVAITGLVLVDHLHKAVAPAARSGIQLAVAALALMWGLDLCLYALSYLHVGQLPVLTFVRGTAMVLIAPLFGLAAHRNGDWAMQVSRTIAYQSISFGGLVVYGTMMVLGTSALGTIAGDYGRLLQTAFVVGTTMAVVTIISSSWLRAWIKVKLAKHFFTHRYDYRTEWLRFTDTLGRPGDGAAPLDERIVKAVADLTDSPAGLLMVPDGAALGQGAAWNWEPGAPPLQSGEAVLARYLEATGRIVELDCVRAGTADPAEVRAVPIWMLDRADAWVLVPLVHFGKLAGAILLARPPIDRRPDWEDLDLLRIAGRQVASYLAEARAQEALSDVQRFDEFNRRFAFIMHDIKNLVSQLSLVARNAERHADNPAFRADMITTLQDSAARMNDLLARLSQHNTGRAEPLGPVEIVPLIERVIGLRRAQHPIATAGLRSAIALADPLRVEQLLGHLLQNAIDASAADDPITVMVGCANQSITIDVIDHGPGMSPAFMREKLFKAFVSSKPGGFGLGAFEARQLAEAMGGRVDAFSREGEGSRFRVTLPAAVTGQAKMGCAA